MVLVFICCVPHFVIVLIIFLWCDESLSLVLHSTGFDRMLECYVSQFYFAPLKLKEQVTIWSSNDSYFKIILYFKNRYRASVITTIQNLHLSSWGNTRKDKNQFSWSDYRLCKQSTLCNLLSYIMLSHLYLID